VKFLPTRKQQTECDDCSENGLNGNLIITYDIKRFKQRGDLEVCCELSYLNLNSCLHDDNWKVFILTAIYSNKMP